MAASGPDTAARLLAWFNRVQPDAAQDVEEIASQIAAGLCEIADCHDAAILVRDGAHEDNLLLAGVYAGGAALSDEEQPPTFLAAPQLWEVLPVEPFLIADAPPQLRAVIREAGEFALAQMAPQSSAAPALAIPLRGLNIAGFMEVIGLALLWGHEHHGGADGVLPLIQTVAPHAGGWLSSALRMERLSRSYSMLAGVFADAVDHRDSAKSETSRAVSYYAGLIARELALPPLHIARIELAGLLHHIGKLSVPDVILRKTIPLTMEEREFVRASIVTGAAWLNTVEGLQEVAEMVRHQGENYDGSGYPEQLAGVEIPVGARVLAVARRFTAMTSRRAERRPLSVVGGALESVTEESGSSFDPRVVNAFLAALGRTV